MSRIGKMPVVIPQGVQVAVADGLVTVKGPKGQLQLRLHRLVRAEVKDGKVVLTADLAAARDASAIYGMSRARVNNMVVGVSSGFSKTLNVVGVGFRA
ncbi:MAG: 50S ribosomal protein L6, partial [Elusimicrobia bacterium]|nr:50S ribosomal protein L6 [Elusimicrobiota bacterium]